VFRELDGIPNIHLLDPVDYLSMVALLDRAVLILTDSGGIQEEAAALGRPVLVLRDKTERMEGVEAGVARMVGTGTEAIVRETLGLLADPEALARMARGSDCYGDGRAAGAHRGRRSRMDPAMKISLVIPCYNEEAGLPSLPALCSRCAERWSPSISWSWCS
jgi:hypothetical protein